MLSFQIFQSKHYPAVRTLFLKCKKPNRGDVGGLLKNTKRDSPKTGARNRQKKWHNRQIVQYFYVLNPMESAYIET